LVRPDAKLLTSGIFPDFDPVYRGRKGLNEFWREMHQPWARPRIASST